MTKRRKQNVLQPNAELRIIRELWCPDKLEVVMKRRKTLDGNVLHIKPSDLLTVFHSLNAGKTPKFDLKRLPREIQDMICRMMFRRDVIEIGAQSTSTIKGFTPFLRTCKWYHGICRPILYSENIFRLQNRKVICGAFFENRWRTYNGYQLVYEFLSGIGPDNRALLRDIRLSLDITQNGSAAGIHYVYEPNLRRALPLLANDGNLTHLTLAFEGYKCDATSAKNFMNLLTEVKTGALGIGNLERSDAENNWWLADPAVRLSKDRVPKDITRCQRLNDSHRNKIMRLMLRPASNPSGNRPRRGNRRTRPGSYNDYYSLQGAHICTRVPVYFGSASTSPPDMVVLKAHRENNIAILRVEPRSVFDLVKSMTTKTCIKNTECQRGLGDFPEKVRKIIYQALFTGKGVINIGIDDDDDNQLPNFGSQVSDFRRSAQFLRVCRLINLEGSDILYRENKFNFRRDRRLRTKSGSLQKVLYEDFWAFIRMISKRNVPRLRDISIKFQDIKEPRIKVDGWWYTRNEDLNNALYNLGVHGKLKQIRLDPQGYHRLQASDTDFLARLLSIKVDHLCFGPLEESCAECCAETARFLTARTFQPQQYLGFDLGVGGWMCNLYCPLAKNLLKKMTRQNPEYPEYGSTDDPSKYHGELCPRCRGIWIWSDSEPD